MALNYQRNSYSLWESSKKTYADEQTRSVFNPEDVLNMSDDELRSKLTLYKVAIQQNKQPVIWRTLCTTISNKFDNDIRNLFIVNEFSIEKIKGYILANKKDFPYLSGSKILNYWLYVIEQYTDANFIDRQFITVAPDTHVIQASAKLGLIRSDEIEAQNIREIVSERWYQALDGSGLCPIDIHTPLWLWSRGGFLVKVGDCIEELSEGGMQLQL